MNTFHNNLKRLRKQRSLKQEELAERLHVTRQTVSGWETGRRQPDLDMLPKLAEALDADVHELIYGSKPGAYPLFQRKYVICTAIFGGITALLILFRLLILPHLRILFHTHHWGFPLTFCDVFLPQVGAFSFGALFPGLVRLFAPIPMKKRNHFYYLACGVAALLPVVLFWLSIPPWDRWFLYKTGNAFLTYILPAVFGACILTGMCRESTDF